MKRVSLVLFVGVGLFIIIVATLMVIRGRGVSPLPEEAGASRADFRIKEVHLQEAAEGGVRWKLDADQAEVFEQEGKTVMQKVTITILQPDRTWTITSEHGDLKNDSKNVRLQGNVVALSSDGVRLSTESLQWAAEPKKLWTNDPITIVRGETSIRGEALDVLVGEERAVVKGRVWVSIPGRKGPSSPLSKIVR
ncbi:MAG TPA: LPS export ABC transporter periplasmic protein LptC [Methylomirabilota bacterium]|nr:LPS export ABC transporter periplasmic protein LptC [Methylomirabilota bacterium]